MIYEHYKGKRYKILAEGKLEATEEDVIVYQALYDDKEFGNQAVWVRPKKEFFEEVEVDGKKVKRFSVVKED